jgi:hypothetical protein
MPKSRGRGRKRQGARRFEQKSTTRPIQQPTVQKAASPTTTAQTAGMQRPTKTAAAQRPNQQVDTSLSHVRGDIIRVGVVTVICILLLVVLWAVLR